MLPATRGLVAHSSSTELSTVVVRCFGVEGAGERWKGFDRMDVVKARSAGRISSGFEIQTLGLIKQCRRDQWVVAVCQGCVFLVWILWVITISGR